TFSGWVIYVIAFLLLFLVGWTLDRFFKPKTVVVKPDDRVTQSSREHATVGATSTTTVAPAEGTE
ncbi:MAG TPA: hypothetical protein VGK82_04905, partial [Pyrinomonadaceae bacterium]